MVHLCRGASAVSLNPIQTAASGATLTFASSNLILKRWQIQKRSPSLPITLSECDGAALSEKLLKHLCRWLRNALCMPACLPGGLWQWCGSECFCMCICLHSNSDAVIGLAAHQERLNSPGGRRYFHLGTCRFGILGTQHEPGLKAAQRDVRVVACVCRLQSGSRLQVEALHWCGLLFPAALSSG